jgi:uncharacterized protein YdeI (YjbR/CyaY-like superfamily)
MITLIEDFFTKGCGRCERFATADCSTRRWVHGLTELRRLCLQSRLVEAVKWGHPCYTHRGRNIAIIGAFRGDFRLTFFDAALMKDAEGLLKRQGPNTRHPDALRFTADDQVVKLATTIAAYLREAMGYAEALDCDPELADAFHSLTPGRQRSYVVNLKSAAKPETRLTRIARFRNKILAGKGATER